MDMKKEGTKRGIILLRPNGKLEKTWNRGDPQQSIHPALTAPVGALALRGTTDRSSLLCEKLLFSDIFWLHGFLTRDIPFKLSL